MFDFLFEMGSSFPWIYRGWVYMISATYRGTVEQEWLRRGRAYKVFDISLSIIFMVLEMFLLFILFKPSL